jgi:hypothetical protein
VGPGLAPRIFSRTFCYFLGLGGQNDEQGGLRRVHFQILPMLVPRAWGKGPGFDDQAVVYVELGGRLQLWGGVPPLPVVNTKKFPGHF